MTTLLAAVVGLSATTLPEPADLPAAVLSATMAGRPITLAEAGRLALARSEEIARRDAAFAGAEARIGELRAAVLPRLSLLDSYQQQEDVNAPRFLPEGHRPDCPTERREISLTAIAATSIVVVVWE